MLRVLRRSIRFVGLLVPVACATAGTVNGTWIGALSSEGAKATGIRFVLEERDGKLVGKTFVEDPVTHEFLEDAELTGSRTGATASWRTTTDLEVEGKFEADQFVGTLKFPADEGRPPHIATLKLSR